MEIKLNSCLKMALYLFREEDLKQMINNIRNSTASDELLLNICKIESKGVINPKDFENNNILENNNTTCIKCGKSVTVNSEHKVHSAEDYWNGNSSEWNCPINEVSKCLKCEKYVDDEYDHCEYEGNQTYSSEWNCEI